MSLTEAAMAVRPVPRAFGAASLRAWARGGSVRVAVAVGGAGAVLGGATSVSNGAVDVFSGAAIGIALGVAQRNPRVGWIAAALAMLAQTPHDAAWGVWVLMLAHNFCAARRERGWWSVAALLALGGTLEINAFAYSDGGRVPAVFVTIAGWFPGRAAGGYDEVAAQLAERAGELEEEREAHAALSVRYERARIASELHDLVAHGLSVMVVQAAAGQRLAADPSLTAQTFAVLDEAARQAQGDMRRLIALLGDEETGRAAPDLALLEQLLARASATGLDVTLRLEGDRELLAPRIAEAAYHVVQEALTNALRYAGGAPVSVLVRGEPSVLRIEVFNARPAATPALIGVGTGTGIAGLRERVGACGGTLEAGPAEDGGWRLAATLPR